MEPVPLFFCLFCFFDRPYNFNNNSFTKFSLLKRKKNNINVKTIGVHVYIDTHEQEDKGKNK
jgi:hypothetical protein